MVDGHDVELWHRDRRVENFEGSSKITGSLNR
jgi:hypothetical protein